MPNHFHFTPSPPLPLYPADLYAKYLGNQIDENHKKKEKKAKTKSSMAKSG